MAIIEIEKLAKDYRVYQKREGLLASVRGLFRRSHRDVHAVRGIDLTVEQGEFVAFLGPNGAGKTTTLKLLSGVIYPSSGTARVMGYVPWHRENAFRRRFALVMGQKNQLWWDLPAQESFRLHQQSNPQALDHFLLPIIRSAAGLLVMGELDRVRECADDRGCGYLFYDTTRNRSRRWCDMNSCGNRAKARRHYARHSTNLHHTDGHDGEDS